MTPSNVPLRPMVIDFKVMSWIGKILGGSVGMMMGGPVGALIGGAIGHLFVDSRMEEAVAEQRRPGSRRATFSNQEQKQAVFFASVFAMLGKMAKADGNVTQAEIRVVEAFMRDHLRLDKQARMFATNIFNRSKDDAYPFTQYASEFARHFHGDSNMRMVLFEILFQVAAADGSLHRTEEHLLRQAIQYLNTPPHLFDELKARLAPSADPAYAILGLTPDATDAEVKKAFRAKVMEFHPDKIVSKGLPEEFLTFAEEKFKEINAAYDKIKKARGLS
ncbi:MAG: TerB family tellurite resistance protein [Verrucomicrobia bacterium]|nr:TerB family tellurite resistance protein [Verrucomicrobiota bacterium]